MSTSESQANLWNKWPYILGIPSFIWAVEYALQISGRSQRLKENLIGVPIAVHRWIIYGFVPFWLFIFSDGVYEVEKSDGSMWHFEEFEDFMSKIKSGSQSRLDRLYRHAENISNQDNFEDDFTILEAAFN